MNKRSHLIFSLACVPMFWMRGACLSMCFGQDSAVEVPAPNIILIMVDDMGYSDIGCYGGEVETPNIDGLAQNGLRFTQFYNTAKCHTTRAELLTGNYAYHIGDRDMKYGATLGEVLKLSLLHI